MVRLHPGIHRSVVRHQAHIALQNRNLLSTIMQPQAVEIMQPQAVETQRRTSDGDLLDRLQDAERRDEEAALSAELSAIGLSHSPTRSPTLIPARLQSLTVLSLAYTRAHQLSHALPRSPSRSGSPAAAATVPRRARKPRLNGASGSRRSRLHQQPSPASLATRHLNGVALTLAVECDGAPYFPAMPRQSCVTRAPRRDWAPIPTGAVLGGGGPRGVSRTRALHGQWKRRSRPLHQNHDASRTHAQPPR